MECHNRLIRNKMLITIKPLVEIFVKKLDGKALLISVPMDSTTCSTKAKPAINSTPPPKIRINILAIQYLLLNQVKRFLIRFSKLQYRNKSTNNNDTASIRMKRIDNRIFFISIRLRLQFLCPFHESRVIRQAYNFGTFKLKWNETIKLRLITN